MAEDAIIKEHVNAFKILLSQMDSPRAPMSEGYSVVIFLINITRVL
jgi:hypothetical protein